MNHPFVRNLLVKQVPWNQRFLQRYTSCFELHRCSIDKFHHQIRCKSDKPTLSSLVVPIEVKVTSNPDDINLGAEITGGKLKKSEIVTIINEILLREHFKLLAQENGIDHTLFQQCFQSFRTFCSNSKVLPTELHIKLYDILHGNGNVDDLFPDFLKHAKQVFPHLECLEELKKISDLTSPVNWYPEARNLNRKIIFHGGPTNSGKTYHALKRFYAAESGVYCAPLKLLAVEVTNKANAAGTKCDLVTGEERFFANEDGTPASHVSCTVEMACTSTPREVAVIDEIQMIKDPQRGWAWTRALLGIPAKEIHLCGEEASLDIIKEILSAIPEEVEVNAYKRLTPLEIENTPLGSLSNVKKGDCIVCFSKKDIFNISLQLEKLGHDIAVIYGSLPPGTKVAQTKKFNDPNDPCNILVATDAIGMGLNLSINRIIFSSLKKPINSEKGGPEIEVIPTSTALQIAGRAGRFNTEYSTGYVTCFNQADLTLLKDLITRPVEPIGAAGLHPTMEQIELFAYHLPKATFSNLFDIFLSICRMDTSCYFMCNVDNIKYLADLIQH
ncbi:ATP-dependent RNA helicase SUV3-like protein, partial [Leptotrombidium deliense]